MRTNIDLDESLVKEAFKYINVKTKKELVRIALKEFVDNHKRRDLKELKGKIKLSKGYDYTELREGAAE